MGYMLRVEKKLVIYGEIRKVSLSANRRKSNHVKELVRKSEKGFFSYAYFIMFHTYKLRELRQPFDRSRTS